MLSSCKSYIEVRSSVAKVNIIVFKFIFNHYDIIKCFYRVNYFKLYLLKNY